MIADLIYEIIDGLIERKYGLRGLIIFYVILALIIICLVALFVGLFWLL